eukprot:COSAG06_NODE_1656_length_8785_cov_23.725996_4_plen_234_part_00
MDECCCETPEANGSLMRLLVFACVCLCLLVCVCLCLRVCVCCVLQGSCPMDEWIEAARRRMVERSMGGAVDGAGAPCPALPAPFSCSPSFYSSPYSRSCLRSQSCLRAFGFRVVFLFMFLFLFLFLCCPYTCIYCGTCSLSLSLSLSVCLLRVSHRRGRAGGTNRGVRAVNPSVHCTRRAAAGGQRRERQARRWWRRRRRWGVLRFEAAQDHTAAEGGETVNPFMMGWGCRAD